MKPKVIILVLAVFSFGSLCLCTSVKQNPLTKTLKNQLKLTPIHQANPSEYPAEVQSYLAHYGLDYEMPDVEHLFGSFESDDFTLAAHIYRPSHYTATAVLLHGYLNHTGQFRHLIRHLLENNIAVTVYDLPGHGLSSGQTAVIDSFDQYVQTAQDCIKMAQRFLIGPYHLLGFSTGAAIAIEMLLNQQANDITKIILVNPLIHWTAYDLSKGTFFIYQAFTDKIARMHRKNSSDKDFLEFNKTQDYLHAKHVSTKWIKALFDWNDKIEAAGSSNRKILIIQGAEDGTVDWKYNLKMLAEKFPNAETKMIPGADHELFNEAPEYKEKALNIVIEYFEALPKLGYFWKSLWSVFDNDR